MRRSMTIAIFLVVLFTDTRAQKGAPVMVMDPYDQRETQASPAEKKILSDLRDQIREKRWSFIVGYTSVADSSLDRIAATTPPNTEDQEEIRKKMNTPLDPAVGLILDSLQLLRSCTDSARSYDARQDGIVPPIRHQQCGNCWAYSAIGNVEISYNRVNNIQAAAFYDLSEKQALDCFGSGTCWGGFYDRVFRYMQRSNQRMMTEAQYPDNGVMRTCPRATPPATTVEIEAWGSLGRTPTVQQIKEAICRYGPVSCCMLATEAFKRYRGGIFDERVSDGPDNINHAVIIIGWDDDNGAWLVRNSWRDPLWGMGGYAWVKYGYNNIGTNVSWTLAKRAAPFARSFAGNKMFEKK